MSRLGRVIANPLLEAATANGRTLEGVDKDFAAVFDEIRFGGRNAGERSTKPCH